jgi:hypothetical protein|tara:strand:- start:669 stop:812 length:144 start_codon:yes stop_codon:yes gene_type:complete
VFSFFGIILGVGLVKGDRNKTAIITAFIIGFLLNIVAALNPYSIKRI